MTQINTCLKRTFIVFNVLFAIIGALLMAFTLLTEVLLNDNPEGFISLYVMGTITFLIAILGAYGAQGENKVSLIVFLVCMITGTLLLLQDLTHTAATRLELEGNLEAKARENLPLDQAPEDVKALVEQQQKDLHCCGLFSYKDWEYSIPNSCLCNQEEQMEGRCEQVGYRGTSIYSQSCFPIIREQLLQRINIKIGADLTLAILALLGMILSSIIIHQMRLPDRPTVTMSVPAIFTIPPPKYEELFDLPAY